MATKVTPATPAAAKPVTPTPQPAGTTPVILAPLKAEEKTSWGRVAAFTVDDNRLMIKLNVSATSRLLVAFPADKPAFRSAVSLTLMAYNNKEPLSVRYLDQPPNIDVLANGGLDIMTGLEVGLGEDAFVLQGWPLKYNG